MSAKFSVLWSNNADFTRPMSKHTFRLRDLGLPHFHNVTVHVDEVHIIFRPTSMIPDSGFVLPDNKQLDWHAETDKVMLRCTPGVRFPMYVGDNPAVADSTHNPYTKDMGHDVRSVQRVCTYSSALASTWNQVGDESYYCRTYRPIRDLPVVKDTTNLSEWTLELFFPLLMGDGRMVNSQVPDYRILKVYCEFSVHW